MLTEEIIKPSRQDGNLQDYEQARQHFDWKEIEKHFTWYETGKVNMAYEAIDRHAASERANKVALIYSDDRREERYTFSELSRKSNQFGNVLRKLGVQKGDRVFIFMPRTPELYISLLGVLKIGAIAGPLFEAFMETAVRDRLADSEAVAIVTTPELLGRVPVQDLPHLKHVIIVGDNLQATTFSLSRVRWISRPRWPMPRRSWRSNGWIARTG
jgi:Acyl-coenzyme A synthetases/AMP-(fatty) acid ligases